MSEPVLYIKRGCPYCAEAMEELDKRGYKYKQVEVRTDPKAMAELQKVSGQTKTPTLMADGKVLANFGVEELDSFLGSSSHKK